MEKLTTSMNFTKSMDILRNTDCKKEKKIRHFRQLTACLLSPSMIGHVQHSKHCSSAVSMLLFFCEDLDSSVRMSAEENLNKIIRSLEISKLSRIFLDLYNEIKKNGNEKSLRICLNLFSYYCPRMKEKNVKWYALKLLPCLQAIALRKEISLIENLCEFMKNFGKYLQVCLNDNETIKLIDVFLTNTIASCPVKRRCSALNCLYLIENSRNRTSMSRYALNKSIEFLTNEQNSNTILGVLGFFRLLIPFMIAQNICDNKKIIEIYDVCLHLLVKNDNNHSIINASLEVINAILNQSNKSLEFILKSHQLQHNDVLKKRKSLKHQIFHESVESQNIEENENTVIIAEEISEEHHYDKQKDMQKVLHEGNDKDDYVSVLEKYHQSSVKPKEGIVENEFKLSNENNDNENLQKFQDNTMSSGIADATTHSISITDKTLLHYVRDEAKNLDKSDQILCNDDVENVQADKDLSKSNEMEKTVSKNIEEKDILAHEENYLMVEKFDNKSQISTDIDNDSFNSIDFESEIAFYEQSSMKGDISAINADSKSLKSTDSSVGSFFNSFLTSNDTLTKLFGPSTKLPSSTATTTTTTLTTASKASDSQISSPKAIISDTKIEQKNFSHSEKKMINIKKPTSSSSFSLLKENEKDSLEHQEPHQTLSSPTLSLSSTSSVLPPKPLSKVAMKANDLMFHSLPTITNPITTTTIINADSCSNVTSIMDTLTLQDDTISLESVNSRISYDSHVSFQSNSQDFFLKNEQDLVDLVQPTDIVDGDDNDDDDKEKTKEILLKLSNNTTTKDNEIIIENKNETLHHASVIKQFNDDDKLTAETLPVKENEIMITIPDKNNKVLNILDIGTIYDQSIIKYTVRLITSKFLLAGMYRKLISDADVRVSIKSLSLQVIANCVRLDPLVLTIPIQYDKMKELQMITMATKEAEKAAYSKDKTELSFELESINDYSSSSNEVDGSFHVNEQIKKDEKYTETLLSSSNKLIGISLNANDFHSENDELMLLDIKDDHFGEGTRESFLFNLPSSAKITDDNNDSVLVSKLQNKTRKTLQYEQLKKDNDDENYMNDTGGSGDSNKRNTNPSKLNYQLEQILSKSEKIDTKSKTNLVDDNIGKISEFFLTKSIPETTNEEGGIIKESLNNTCMPNRLDWVSADAGEILCQNTQNQNKTKDMVMTMESKKLNLIMKGQQKHHSNQHQHYHQFVYDVILFYNHADPSLRGNVQIIVGNYIYGLLLFNEIELLLNGHWNLNKLLAILIKGLKDEIHTVIVHALTSFDKIFPFLMFNYCNVLNKQIISNKIEDNDNEIFIEKLLDTIINATITDESNLMKKFTSTAMVIEDTSSTYDNDDKIKNSHQVVVENDDKKKDPINNNNTFVASDADVTNTLKCTKGIDVKNIFDEIVITPKLLLNQLVLCCDNKYWVIQNKFIEVIAKLDYEMISEYYDEDTACLYEEIFLNQLLQYLSDDDVRVREHAAEYLCIYIKSINSCGGYNQIEYNQKIYENNLVNLNVFQEFFDYRIFLGMSSSLRNLLINEKTSTTMTPTTTATTVISMIEEKLLSKVLYLITNKLMELSDKNLQFGMIFTMKSLLNHFNPIDYAEIWNEFNIDEICLTFACQNYSIAIDLQCQSDLMEICSKLLAANILIGQPNNKLIDTLLVHTLKLLNVYYHLFLNQKPAHFIKSHNHHKHHDLFSGGGSGINISSGSVSSGGNTKEITSNPIGYIGNDYYYIKLYNTLKSVHEIYKTSVNQESGLKLLKLLSTSLRTLSTCLDMKAHSSTSSSFSIKLIEEILQYLTILINYEPVESIKCLQQLLKYLFGRNYANRMDEYEKFTKLYLNIRRIHLLNENDDERCYKEYHHHHHQQQQLINRDTNENCIYEDLLTNAIINFPLKRNKMEEDLSKHIKLFEPLVVYCLTVFMKSNATIQAPILELLSLLLEFNVTYSVLDSKNVIFEQVMKNLELIESGIARNATIIICPTIKFLMALSKQNDKKLITIPKILSIINGLMVNNGIKNCSILALKALVFEIYFNEKSLSLNNTIISNIETGNENNSKNRIISGDCNTTENISSSRELNTQKEVIYGMLEKFIDCIECHKTLTLLLYWNKMCTKQQIHQEESLLQIPPTLSSLEITTTTTATTNPTTTDVLKSLDQDEKVLCTILKSMECGQIKIEKFENFYVFDSLFLNIDTNVLLKSKNFQTMLSLFITKNVYNFSNLSQVTIILDKVLQLKTEEIYFVNQIKLFLERSQIYSTNCDELKFFANILHEKIETCISTLIKCPNDNDYFHLVVKFIRVLCNMLSKSSSTTTGTYKSMNSLKSSFKFVFLKENKLLKKIYYHQQQNSNNTDSSSFYCTNGGNSQILTSLNLKYLQMEILKVLCELNIDEISLLLLLLKEVDDKKMQSVLLQKVFSKFNDPGQWTFEDVNCIFSKEFFVELLNEKFAILLCQNVECSEIIFNKLFNHMKHFKMTQIPNVITLIKNLKNTSVSHKIDFLSSLSDILNEETRKTKNKALKRLTEHTINEEIKLFEKCSKVEREMKEEQVEENIKKSLSNATALEEIKVIEEDTYISSGNGKNVSNKIIAENKNIDEKWLIEQIIKFSKTASFENYAKILLDLKSESKIKTIFAAIENTNENTDKILRTCIKVSLDEMIKSFQQNCILYNPHINYLNMNPLCKVTLNILINHLRNITKLFTDISSSFDTMENISTQDNDKKFLNTDEKLCIPNENNIISLALTVTTFLRNIENLEKISLVYIEYKFIQKFIKEQIFKQEELIQILIDFCFFCAKYAKILLKFNNNNANKKDQDDDNNFFKRLTLYECIDCILRQNFIWLELNQFEKYVTYLNSILDMLYDGMIKSIKNTIFYKRYKTHTRGIYEENDNIEQNDTDEDDEEVALKDYNSYVDIGIVAYIIANIANKRKMNKNDGIYDNAKNENFKYVKKAIFIGKLIEMKNEIDTTAAAADLQEMQCEMKILNSIAISLLRTNLFYSFAVTPLDIFRNNGKEKLLEESNCQKLLSIPIEHLSDVDVLQKFVKRLFIFGFSTRQQFEECFMTFLLLINKNYDENMVDEQEQFQIKNTCLTAILELLINCKTFPVMGKRNSQFFHTTRWSKIKCDSISMKKLHKVQLIIPGSNVFYHPNLERKLSPSNYEEKYNIDSFASHHNNNIDDYSDDNIIGTNLFMPNQYGLIHVWQLMEERLNDSSGSSITTTMSDNTKEDILMKNFRYFIEISKIDLKSSLQLIFDVLTQIFECNHILVLPNLVKFCEICENRDQIKLIKDKLIKLQETVPIDDTISHQHIIYLLCKTQSILIPSSGDLGHLCSLISTYLKSNHVFIRNATLHGLLCLLDSCSKTSTSIGKLSEELCMLRDLIIGYIGRHGITQESNSIRFSDMHTKLIWTLNFSLIEVTSKFVPDCNLFSESIISANNLLKRTTNENIYFCILHGLERIIIIDGLTKMTDQMRNKIEKLAIDLFKMENERFSIPALKLLLSCIYIGSKKQLENTENSNGIVQDDPEIIIQQTEKVDILLHRIKSSTASAAKIYGQVLCQIIRDLVPPNEILTKVVKEFLATNQPHCEIIAGIVYQVFRSAIDSSFLQMLQDWLICSLPTFVTLTEEMSVWCLTVLFISASINLHLIKLFPIVLKKFQKLGENEFALFLISSQDFYAKLNSQQKESFKKVFQQTSSKCYQELLENL